jgi:hypothetical protein
MPARLLSVLVALPLVCAALSPAMLARPSGVVARRSPPPLLVDKPVTRPSVRYISESEMESHVRGAALEQGVPSAEAQMYASCARNIYGLGCVYSAETLSRIEEILVPPAKAGEGWALLMIQCARGLLPRLRSEPTALARMKAARGAAARRKQQAGRSG